MRHTDVIGDTEEKQNLLSTQIGIRPDIEGLRAVAVMAVVLFHADVPGVGGGYIGVDVFFVISGFLITNLLWREVSAAGTVRLRRFYGARARRLLPASALVGVATAIASTMLLPPLQAKSVLADGIASALYVSNYKFLFTGVNYLTPFMPPSPFLHYWSLGVEEQFYLVWPVMILCTAWLIRRAHRRKSTQVTASRRPYLVILAVVATVSFALSLAITQIASFVAFFSLPTRAWQLAVGGLVALTMSKWGRMTDKSAGIAGWAGFALILVACTQLSSATPYPGTAALLPVIGAALVIGAGCAAPKRGFSRVLSLSPLRAVGRLSYSLYLWHWPVLLLAAPLLGHPLGIGGRLVAVLVSFGLAALTLRLVENPLRFAASLRRSAARSLALGAAVTAIAVCVCVLLMTLVPNPVGRGTPATALTVTARPASTAAVDADDYDAAVHHTFAQVKAAVAEATELNAVPQNLRPPLDDAADELLDLVRDDCMRDFLQVVQPQCAMGDTASPTTVALIGDSHATMWVPAFQQIAKQRHWRLEAIGKGQCPPMNLPIANPFHRLTHIDCERWRHDVVPRLRAEHPRLVVVSMFRGYATHGYFPGYTPYGSAWIHGLAQLVQELRGTGAKVLVIGPIPDPHRPVPLCLSGHLNDATACSATRSAATDETGMAAESAATTAGGGQFADVTDLFCTADACPVIVGNNLVYFDDSHVTAEYAEAVAPAIGALADRVLASG